MAPAVHATPNTPAVRPRPKLRISDLISSTAAEIDARIGEPVLVRRGDNGEVRIYRNTACVLHVFAYPKNGTIRAVHIEARTQAGRLNGDALDNCVANFGQS